MSISCSGTIKNSPIVEALRAQVNDDKMFNTFYNYCVASGEFTADFRKYLADNTEDFENVTNIDDISAENANTFANYMMEYYMAKEPSVSDTYTRATDNSNVINTYGYTSVSARENAIRQGVNIALRNYIAITVDEGTTLDNYIKENYPDLSKKEALAAIIANSMQDEIFNTLVDAGIVQDTDEDYDAMPFDNINELEKLIEKINSNIATNRLAAYKEMIFNTDDFFGTVFRNSKLSKMRLDSELKDFNDYEALDSLEDEDESNSENEDTSSTTNTEVDNTLNDLNNHDGQFQSFLKHLDEDIKLYFNALLKLNSERLDDYDLNNELGLPDTMNADECAAMLYSYTNRTNQEEFINSIKMIADNIPGFKAFHRLVDDLNNNSDLKFKFYTIFGKNVFSKTETRKTGNTANTRTVNRTANRLTALRFEYLEALKTTALYLDRDISFERFNKITDEKTMDAIKGTIESLNKARLNKDDAKASLHEAALNAYLQPIYQALYENYQRFIPTMEEFTITNFIDNANNGDVLKNIVTLKTHLNSILNSSNDTNRNYLSLRSKIAEVNRSNRQLLEARDAAKTQGMPYSEPKLQSTANLWATDYTHDSTKKDAFELADLLINYAPTKVELNCRNVHGNQSSDVLNNNMITNLLNTLQSNLALQNYGNYKNQSSQYDYSNIMIEHKDEKGNIINYGLFTQDPITHEVKPTPYAKRLLKASLFNGGTNVTTNESALYKEMSTSDYEITSFINFFNTEEFDYTKDPKDTANITYANYFFRTPSDAPKNFIFTSARYSTRDVTNTNSGLFNIQDYKQAKAAVNKVFSAIPTYHFADTDVQAVYDADEVKPESLMQISEEEFIDYLIGKNLNEVKIKRTPGNNLFKKGTNVKDGEKLKIAFSAKIGNGYSKLILEGEYANNKEGSFLTNAKLVGYEDTTLTDNTDFVSTVKKYIEADLIAKGDIVKDINTNHPVFKQLVNIFKQELTNCAIAIDHIFENTNGVVSKNNGEIVFKDGFDNTRNGARKCYTNYHVGKGKTILDTTKEKNQQLSGAVFSSDRFTITTTDENGNVIKDNYGAKFINDTFDLIYGGENDSLKTKKGLNNKLELDLTTEQEAGINDMIKNFINAYLAKETERFKEYNDFIPTNLVTDENLTEYFMNYFITYNNYNDLFEGDSKFYKSVQDLIKRTKETQGSGVPYGIVNYEADYATSSVVDSTINNVSFSRTDVDGNKVVLNKYKYEQAIAEGHSVEEATKIANSIIQTDKFRGVTITNTVRTGKTIGEKVIVNGVEEYTGVLYNELVSALQNKRTENGNAVSDMTEAEAKVKAADMLSGYEKTTVNDAQSYITFEEWVRRITARGQYNKYKSLIERILDETKPVDAETLGQFVQVQKNFYYDHYYNAQLGVTVPRQIKNAEFVIIPRFVKGTQLEQVYDLMQKYDINQLNTEETSKAGKCNVLSLWDNDGNLTEENIADFEANVNNAVELYNYNYLYTQQETPQHMNAENKAGIQIMKKILDNITSDSALAPYKDLFFKLYSAKIQNSFNDLMNELNVEVDENGNLKLDDDGNIVGLNKDVLLDKFRAEAFRLNLDSNMLDYYTATESIGDNWAVLNTLMPFYMSNVSTKVENIAQAIFNNHITRQKLPGFHAAQITNIGWKNVAEDKSKYAKTKLKRDSDFKTFIKSKHPEITNITKLEVTDELRDEFKSYLSDKFGTLRSYSKDLRYHPEKYVNKDTNKWIDVEEYNNLPKEEKDKYTKAAQPVIEIKVPRSVFNFQKTKNIINPDGTTSTVDKTDEELLKELQKAGLDNIIGYRIPTEGKQSICVMQIVGFTDEALGSTIIVPDDWVSQTGSDFDIDSVYTITADSYIDKNGHIRKSKYKDAKDISIYDWYKYIEREGKKLNKDFHHAGVSENYDDIIADAKAKTKEEIANLKDPYLKKTAELQAIQSIKYYNLPEDIKSYIKDINTQLDDFLNNLEGTKLEKYYTRLVNIEDAVSNYIKDKDLSKLDAKKIDEYIKSSEDIRDNLNDYNANVSYDYNELKSSKINSSIESVRRQQLLAYEKTAKDNNLLSYEEFINKTKEDINFINSKGAIDNGILDSMIAILQSPLSLEENLSRSNFEDIIAARKEAMDPNVKARRDNRSAYNFHDQAEFMGEVMSGAGLKAFSVVRDTLCSICNTVRPKINDMYAMSVIYNANDYKLKDLQDAFDNVEEIKQDSKVIAYKVKHNTFGWSKNNKNAIGKIITAYSSQTTAHILDAVKEGAIPNVNEYTFQVYKSFPDFGSDYRTGVSFIMQPGISEIVKAYQKSNSIYAYGGGDPVKNAFKAIAKKIDPSITKEKTLVEIIKSMQIHNSKLASIFKTTDPKFKIDLDTFEAGKLAIDGDMLRDRLNNKGIFEGTSDEAELNRNLFDLGVVMQFNRLNQFGSKISSTARVCNPDKFGAKQSIFATNQVFDNLTEIIEDDQPVLFLNKEVTNSEDKTTNEIVHFVNAIYPGFNGNLEDYIKSTDNNSAYPPLHNFLKYATATSIKVNRMLFETQNPEFVKELLKLREVFSRKNGKLAKLDEKTYKNYQNYVISHLYSQVDVLAKNVTINENGDIVFNAEVNTDDERSRIYGYGRTPDLKVTVVDKITDENGIEVEVENKHDFTVADIKDPKKEELELYTKLSPAQKVLFIQQNLYDAGVFKYLKVVLFNAQDVRADRAGSQTIEFIDGSVDIETIYSEFEQAFYNSNPLIKLAAIDLIKYGFIVEGFRMKKNSVNKIIKNNCLYESIEDGGLSIIDELNNKISQIKNNTIDMDLMRDNFIRSHSDISQISLRKVEKVNKKYEVDNYKYFDMYVFPKSEKELIDKYALGYTETIDRHEIVRSNSYVKLAFGNKTKLYKLVETGNEIIAYPLNKLQANENSEFSVNYDNNRDAYLPCYYQMLIDEYTTQQAEKKKTLTDIYREHLNARDDFKFKKEYTKTTYAQTFSLDEEKFIDTRYAIEKYFSANPLGALYLRSSALATVIRNSGEGNGSIQQLPTTVQKLEGKKFIITKVDTKRYNSLYFGKKANSKVNEEQKEKLDPQVRAIMENAEKYQARVNDLFYIIPYNDAITAVPMLTEESEESEEAVNTEDTVENPDTTTIPNEAPFSTRNELAVSTNLTYSTRSEFGVAAMNAMYNSGISNNDNEAMARYKALRDKQIECSSASVEMNIQDVITTIAEYTQSKAEKLQNDLNYFTLDDDDNLVNIINDASINAILNNPLERNRFLKLILDCKAFVSNYGLINSLDVSSEDEGLKVYLERIKKNIDSIKNSTLIDQAETIFAQKYLAKLSNNPNIQNDLLNILDGYHSASALDAWINDLQETSSPILQILSKEVMEDLRTKEMLSQQHVKEFRDKIEAIIKEAKEKGYDISWDNIIDKNGKFVQDYSQAFLDDMTRLRDKERELRESNPYSIEHMNAKYEYDKWKVNHVNREGCDEYYFEHLAEDEELLNSFPTIYCEYHKLYNQRLEILRHTGPDGKFDDNFKDELDAVTRKLNNLMNTYTVDETGTNFIDKRSIDDPTNPYKYDEHLTKLYSLEAAKALKKYVNRKREIEDYYKKTESKLGFEEELEKNLNIIRKKELRSPNGTLIKSMDELLQDKEYAKARKWISENARWEVDSNILKKINDAFAVFSEGKQGHNTTKELKAIIDAHKAYDDLGFIDATNFTDEEIARIKAEQERKYKYSETAPYSDTHLLSNALPNGVIFSSAFYSGFKSKNAKHSEYLKKVGDINKILQKYYNPNTKQVHTGSMDIEDLRLMRQYYQELEEIKAGGPSNASKEDKKAIAKYIKENVEFITNNEAFDREEAAAKTKGEEYHNLWLYCNHLVVTQYDGTIQRVKNPYLYSYAAPKGFNPDKLNECKYVDHKKMEALKVINSYCNKIKTPYYYDKFNKMAAIGGKAFETWYHNNHIFNPNTRAYEPLACWMKNDIQALSEDGTLHSVGKYVPSYKNSVRSFKNGKSISGEVNYSEPDFTNHNYNKTNPSYAANYKKEGLDLKNTNTTKWKDKKFKDNINYNNNLTANEYESKIKRELQKVMSDRANTTTSKNFINSGYAPIKHKSSDKKDSKFWIKEALKMVGITQSATGREEFMQDNEVDYAFDNTPSMPYMSKLTNYKSELKKEDFESDEDYQKALKEEEIKYNAENHDTNWIEVFSDFIEKADKFNAIQDNKYMLYYGKNMLDKIDVYIKNLGFNNFKRSGKRYAEEGDRYATQKDQNLKEQYTNWVRRIIYDQWKEPNNRYTRAANVLQSFTSAKFMMLNITGGIANVTAGNTQIFGEIFAREHFGAGAWAAASKEYAKGTISYFADMYKPTSSTLQNAIIKAFQIVDYDEVTGTVHEPDAEEYLKRARDLAFSPQAMGEHAMQNTALFAILKANRLVVDTKSVNHGLKYTIATEESYARDSAERALLSMLDDKQLALWHEFVKYEKSDANNAKDYNWFRKDLTTEFANIYLTKEQKKEFIKKAKEYRAKAIKEFNDDKAHPTLYSQFALGKDGKLAFKEGSILESMGNDAYRIMARAKNRTISVNKKIHGVYDRLGSAQIEKYWWGPLVMQYHKHLYPGIMKRYRRQGYFNEERGTIEKGCYAAIKDFLSLPLHKKQFRDKLKRDNNMTDSQLQCIEGIQNVVKDYIDFALNANLNWSLIPEHERANMRRAFGDVCGTLSALFMAVGLHLLSDDDDESLAFNLAMYECDRLASEANQFNPFGLYAEGKKLWSSPVAVQGAISDAFNSISLLIQLIMQGDEFNPIYTTGLNAGENKFEVMLKRNIPMYHSINMLQRLYKSNKYYKLGQNVLGVIPVKDIADWIKH